MNLETRQLERPDDLIVAFRTHLWNDDIAFLARRLRDASAGTRFVILADETNGVLETSPFEKIAHYSDFASFGLPNYPRRSVLWYNADYPLYVLRAHFPKAEYFAMVEYDVSMNVDFGALMRHAQSNGIDFVAHKIAAAPPSWFWHKTIAPHFLAPMKALIASMIISSRAIDALLTRRRTLLAAKVPEIEADWPYCEGFIPSVIAEFPDFRMDDIGHHAELPFYDWTNPVHMKSPEANAPGTISHPVLGGMHFIDRRLAYDKPEAIFDPDSMLNRQLSFYDPVDFIGPLTRLVKSKRSFELLERFRAVAERNSWPTDGISINLAYAKPATQSSTCEWSRFREPDVDAIGANNGNINGGFGFHTAFELNPWWQVDLEQDFAITKVVVFNRLGLTGRCTRMSVSSSDDGENWLIRGAKLDDVHFGGADGNPYVFFFEVPFVARFIRISMIGEGFLHLDEVEVYGDRIGS